MLSGFYTIASGMLTQQRVLNTISNNIANVNTPGFRTEHVVTSTFETELLRQESGTSSKIGAGSPIRVVKDVQSNFDPNFLQQTDRPYDVAIVGEGYFHINGADREYMTRNGNFDIDEEGFLVLRGAGRVLGEKGELQVKDAKFRIEKDGTVYDSKNKKIDKIKVTMPAEGIQLEKFSNGLYFVPDVTTNVPSTGITLNQGQVERSNIDLNREYTAVMEAQRVFQSCGAAIKIIDQLNQKTATQIASI